MHFNPLIELARPLNRSVYAIFAIVAALGLPVAANAAISSTFDTDADGWSGMTFTNQGVFLNNTLPGFAYHSVGGNPGGNIATTDPGPTEAARLGAPGKFLGNQANVLGGSLAFDLTIDRTGQVDQNPPPLVLIQNGGHSLLFLGTPVPVVGIWTSYLITLQPQPPASPFGVGWYAFTAGNVQSAVAATQNDFNTVFANITQLSITGEFINDGANPDTVGLDNVVMSAVPVPAGWALLLSAMGAMASARRSRR
jgi:hypothetical protein